jgi:UDP-glucose 4-epimerase
MLLIFGGTGFIGKNLCAELHGQGRAAMVVSRSPDAEFLKAYAPSITSMTLGAFWDAPEGPLSRATGVVYAAGVSTPGVNVDAPWNELSETVAPVMRLAKAVADADLRMIYLSSGGAIYGNTGGKMVPETRGMHPVSPYGLGKMQTEQALAYYHRAHGLRYVVLRPSNPVGRWQTNSAQGVIGVLLRQAASGGGFTLFGDGSTVRDYVCVEDLSAAILAALDTDKFDPAVWNIGSGEGRTTRSVYDMVCEISGVQIALSEQPARPSDVDHLVLDVSRAKADLGWEAKGNLEAQVAKLWAEMRG